MNVSMPSTPPAMSIEHPQVPLNIERRRFAEARVTGFRLRDAAVDPEVGAVQAPSMGRPPFA